MIIRLGYNGAKKKKSCLTKSLKQHNIIDKGVGWGEIGGA